MTFSALGLLSPILRVIEEVGYVTPTAIQQQSIPAILEGQDLMATAQTGTGKTASFVLPLLQRLGPGQRVKANHIRALILTPTRELAQQLAEAVRLFRRYLPLKSGVVFGGVKINPQMMRLRGGTDVLIATPGRLLDLYRQNAVRFTQLEILVLDEADRMLDLGFRDDILKLIALLPNRRQTLLFSATSSLEVQSLVDGLLKCPVQIEINPPNMAATSVRQYLYQVDKEQKPALLVHLIRSRGWTQVLVFVRSRERADSLVTQLVRAGISAAPIHGDKSQAVRSRNLAEFKANRVAVLVATDVAARGIDVLELPLVVNFDLPKVAEDYIHRIGRTGRAGLEGEGVSLVSADEVKILSRIETLLGQTLERKQESGFIPTHKVPLTRQLAARPKKPKKSKQITAGD